MLDLTNSFNSSHPVKIVWIFFTIISPHFRNAVFKNGSKLIAEILYQLVYGIHETIKVCIGGTSRFLDFPEMFKIIGKEFEPPKIAPTPRRKPVKMIEVVCHACGKKEEVNPAYKTGNYHRCARCVG